MTKFIPDTVSPPGDTIIDLLEEKDWSQKELAKRLGYDEKHISQLLTGKAPLSLDAAQRLERVLGSTTQFWLSRETKYREHLARIEAQKQCAEWISWLDKLPIPELKKAGVLPNERLNQDNKPTFVEKCLRFFGVAAPEQWAAKYGAMEVAFRRSQQIETDIGAVSAWLRLGEIAAEKIDDKNKYNKDKFKKALEQIRALTIESPEVFEPKLRQLCLDAGVAFVVVPAISKARVSGAARWLNNHKPLIQLSLFGKTNDKFWFTFFHEAAHILLHADKKEIVYLDNPSQPNSGVDYEKEADEWAGNTLIPSEYVAQLSALRTKSAVCDFSAGIGIHPAIVVGRLQHDKLIEPSWMNDLKVSFRLIESTAQ